jgi:drug/metabolite transporter (DMT)-like permease
LAVPLQQRYGSLPIFWRAQMVALVLTLGPALWHVRDASPDVGGWLAVAVLGCLGTGLAYVLAGNLAGRVGGARASVITYLIPPWSIAVGVAFLSESVASVALLGTLIVLVGAFLTTRRDDRAGQLKGESADVAGADTAAATDQTGP